MRMTYRIFDTQDLQAVLTEREQEALSEVTRDVADLTDEEATLLAHQIAYDYRLEELEVNIDAITRITDLSGEDPFVAIEVPFTGSELLFKCKPKDHLFWNLDVYTSGNLLCFDTYIHDSNIRPLLDEIHELKHALPEMVENVNREVSQFNESLVDKIAVAISVIRQKRARDLAALDALNIPLREI